MYYFSVNDIISVNEKKQIMVINNNAEENILLIGGCRITPILNYLINDDLFGNKYNYLCVLVYVDQMIQLSDDIIYNEEIKNQIFQSKILIAEYCKSYNYFNTQRLSEKCIFQIQHSFAHEIIIPNWADVGLYTKTIVNSYNLRNDFDKMINSEITLDEFTQILCNCQEKEVNRQIAIYDKSGFPELSSFLKGNLKTIRLAYSINHLTNTYFIELYRLIIEKNFAQAPYFLPQSVIDINNAIAFLENPSLDIKMTYYDSVCLGININENYLDINEAKKYIFFDN